MLELFLNQFRSYDMDDLEFIIVNTKLSHARDRLPELQSLVSFNVYQETEEEEVWSVMEGGKDDMFIYDRCGRLTYFVPYPLSILNENNVVYHAIISTYFENPCGGNCNANNTLEFNEFVENIEINQENLTTVTEVNHDYNITEQLMASNNTNEEDSPNDLLYIIHSQSEFDTKNTSDFNNITDLEYPFPNITVQSNERNDTVGREKGRGGYLNILYKLFFFNTETNYKSEDDSSKTLPVNETANNGTAAQLDNIPSMQNKTLHAHEHNRHHAHEHNRNHAHEHNHNHAHEHNHIHAHEHNRNHAPHKSQASSKKRDRCVEADYAVCKNWSKQRLLYAQKCCSLRSEPQNDNQNKNNCQNFSKRRCKKIQSILKCCIKTLYTEATESMPLQEKTAEVNEVVDVVCCKSSNGEKICRSSETKHCDEGEMMENSLHNTKCEKHP